MILNINNLFNSINNQQKVPVAEAHMVYYPTQKVNHPQAQNMQKLFGINDKMSWRMPLSVRTRFLRFENYFEKIKKDYLNTYFIWSIGLMA